VQGDPFPERSQCLPLAASLRAVANPAPPVPPPPPRLGAAPPPYRLGGPAGLVQRPRTELDLGRHVAALAALVHRAGGLLEAHPPPFQEGGAYRVGGVVRHMAAPIPGPLPPPAPLALVDRSREGALRALLALLANLALVVVRYTAVALPPPPGVLPPPAPVPPPVSLALALAAHNMKGGHCPPPALLALEGPVTLHMAAGLAPAGLAPAGLAPAGLAPAGLAPAGLAPAGLAPAGLAPAGLHMTAALVVGVVLHMEEGLLQAPLGLKQKKTKLLTLVRIRCSLTGMALSFPHLSLSLPISPPTLSLSAIYWNISSGGEGGTGRGDEGGCSRSSYKYTHTRTHTRVCVCVCVWQRCQLAARTCCARADAGKARKSATGDADTSCSLSARTSSAPQPARPLIPYHSSVRLA
jgi:hypothetical protein